MLQHDPFILSFFAAMHEKKPNKMSEAQYRRMRQRTATLQEDLMREEEFEQQAQRVLRQMRMEFEARTADKRDRVEDAHEHLAAFSAEPNEHCGRACARSTRAPTWTTMPASGRRGTHAQVPHRHATPGPAHAPAADDDADVGDWRDADDHELRSVRGAPHQLEVRGAC